MKHKTAELTGALLDAAVALAEGLAQDTETGFSGTEGLAWYSELGHRVCKVGEFNPSTNWLQGGPIIDREDIQLGGYGTSRSAEIRDDTAPWVHMWGETSLIAAMRCYVASKLGDEVDL